MPSLSASSRRADFGRSIPNKYERSLRRRRMVAHALLWSILAGFGWVVIESAQALSLF